MPTPAHGLPAAPSENVDLSPLGEKGRVVNELIARYRAEPASLVTLLFEVNKRVGSLPEAVVRKVASAYETAVPSVLASLELHHHIRPLAREDDHGLGICRRASCAARGGWEVERILQEKRLAFEPVECQGACDLGPIACHNRGAPLPISAARTRSLAKAEPDAWEDVLSVEKPVHAFKTDTVVAYANIFAKNSHQLATARRHGVYAPVEKALAGAPEGVLSAVKASGLLDCGGGEGPVAPRWEKVRASPGAQKYLVVLADEPLPGTFKDRIILERDPHLLLAGAVLAAYAVGATEAFLYIRSEYELAIERCRTAVEEATRAGLLGDGVAGSKHNLRVYVRVAAGSFVVGARSAALESLEGKPPRPRADGVPIEQSGLFGAPTLVEDVETLSLVPAIVEKGPEWFRGLGRENEAGVKVFCLAGDVKRPGNYELNRGTPANTLVQEFGQGLGQGKKLTGLLVNGALLPPDASARELSDHALAELGGSIGAGAVVAITEKSCAWDLARRETAFISREACGRCEACKLGTRALNERLDKLQGLERDEVQARLAELTRLLDAAPDCGMARRAKVPFATLAQNLPEAVEAHYAGLCTCAPRKKAK